MSRMLAAKAALSARVDAIGSDTVATIGLTSVGKLSSQLDRWTKGVSHRISNNKSSFKQGKYVPEM